MGRWAAVAGLTLLGLLAAGCTSNHHGASGSSAAPSSGAESSSAPGSPTATAPVASVRATPSLRGTSVELRKGLILQIVLPSAGSATGQQMRYGLQPAGSHVLSPLAGAPGFFMGTSDGTATVLVTQAPSCSPGVACAAHIVSLGSVTVTVSG